MEIERNVHSLVSEVKEHVEDFTVLTVRKQHPDINRDHLALIMSIVRQAVDDGFMTKIDKFMGRLDESLVKFVAEANPLEPKSGQPAPSPKGTKGTRKTSTKKSAS